MASAKAEQYIDNYFPFEITSWSLSCIAGGEIPNGMRSHPQQEDCPKAVLWPNLPGGLFHNWITNHISHFCGYHVPHGGRTMGAYTKIWYHNAFVHLNRLDGYKEAEHAAIVSSVWCLLWTNPDNLLSQDRLLLEGNLKTLGSSTVLPVIYSGLHPWKQHWHLHLMKNANGLGRNLLLTQHLLLLPQSPRGRGRHRRWY